MKNKKGFTLIEMLIVVAIIAILSGLILTGLGKARTQARDAKRMAQAKNLASQLEVDANANNGKYTGTPLCNAGTKTIGADTYTIQCGDSWYCISVATENINTTDCINCPSGKGTCTCTATKYCVSSESQ